MTTYTCLIVPDDPEQRTKIPTAKQYKLMFFYRTYTAQIESAVDDVVTLQCKAFKRHSTDVATVFTCTMTRREFEEKSTQPDFVVTKRQLTPVDDELYVMNFKTRNKAVHRMLTVSQTNIFTNLNKCFIRCGADIVKWYVYTSVKISGAHAPYTYTNICTVIDQHHCNRHIVSNEQSHVLNVFDLYRDTFGGSHDRLRAQVDMAIEYATVARESMGKLIGVYHKFNQVRDINPSTIAFCSLKYFDVLHTMFQSVTDILTVEDSTIDAAFEDYEKSVKDVSEEGVMHVKKLLSETVRYEPYNREVHSGYNFPTTSSSMDRQKRQHGVTTPMSCGKLAKSVINDTVLEESPSRVIKGCNAFTIATLCNANNKMILSGEPVKNILANRYGISVDRAFVSTPVRNYYEYGVLEDPAEMDEPYSNPTPLKAVLKHVQNPSMASFNRYVKAFHTNTPKTTFNEIICPRYPIFALVIDVDAKDLVSSFYNNTVADTWPVRDRLVQDMTNLMPEFLQFFNHDMTGETPLCYAYESWPSTSNHVKVGLRLVYRFKRLVFKHKGVVQRFLAAFANFVYRRIKSVGCSIDSKIYAGTDVCHSIRLPMNYKKDNQRRLVPLHVRTSREFLPSTGLVHARHPHMDSDNHVRVMSEIGDVTELISQHSRSALQYKLMIKSKQTASTMDMTTYEDHTFFFMSILQSVLMGAIHSTSSGGGVETDMLTGVHKEGRSRRYKLTPLIRWCCHREHDDANGNPCKYFISVNPDGVTYCLFMWCFGCKYHKVYKGSIDMKDATAST